MSRNSKLARGRLHSLQNRNYDNVYHKNTKLRAKTSLLVEKKYSFQNSQNLTQTPTCLKYPHTLRVQQACEHCRPQRFNACVFLSPANQIVEGIVFSRVCLFTGGSHVTITHDDCTRTLPPRSRPPPWKWGLTVQESPRSNICNEDWRPVQTCSLKDPTPTLLHSLMLTSGGY